MTTRSSGPRRPCPARHCPHPTCNAQTCVCPPCACDDCTARRNQARVEADDDVAARVRQRLARDPRSVHYGATNDPPAQLSFDQEAA